MLQKSKIYENYLRELLNTDSIYGWDWITTPTTKVNNITENTVLTNMLESDQDYRYELSTPGFNKTDIKVEIVGKKIIVTGDKKNDTKVEYISKEYYTTKFSRSFETPENIILDEVYAKIEDGITTLFIPKETVSKDKTTKRLVEVL